MRLPYFIWGARFWTTLWHCWHHRSALNEHLDTIFPQQLVFDFLFMFNRLPQGIYVSSTSLWGLSVRCLTLMGSPVFVWLNRKIETRLRINLRSLSINISVALCLKSGVVSVRRNYTRRTCCRFFSPKNLSIFDPERLQTTTRNCKHLNLKF